MPRQHPTHHQPSGPAPGQTPPLAATPMWSPIEPDADIQEAAAESPAMGTWLRALTKQGEATMRDSNEERLYGQAPDVLRQAGIDPTPEAIDDWVTSQLDRPDR